VTSERRAVCDGARGVIIRKSARGVKLDFLTVFASGPYDALSGAAANFLGRLDSHIQQLLRFMIELRYGTDSQLWLDLDSDAQVAVCDVPRGDPLEDVRRAVADALESPLQYPPLQQTALPGDRVVLALHAEVPRAPEIVAETIDVLLSAGVSPGDITVLSTAHRSGDSAERLLSLVDADVRDQITALLHDPRDRSKLSYLAAAADASPIYLHRAIHDADLVISVGVLRLPDSLDYHGIHSGLFPAFSDAETQARFHSPKALAPEQRSRLDKLSDEVGWLVGTRFTIQIVPGDRDDILHVVAGDTDAVVTEGQRLCRNAWSVDVPQRAGLVVASLTGEESQQTWENVARALAAATRVLDDQGDVIICTRLTEPLGPALERIIGSENLQVALREIARDKSGDGLIAAQLAEVLERGNVYLLSDLDDPRLEDLGVLPIDQEDVSRVAGRYASLVVVPGAQFAQATVGGESSRRKSRSGRPRS
jgi:nickel-dependent lactate racemase